MIVVLEEIYAQCLEFRWANPLKLRNVPVRSVDRTQPLIGGPLFTSPRYPWPSVGGRWLEPIVQLDLAFAGSLANIPLGDGFIQLWMDGEVPSFRVVPSSHISIADLSAPPGDLGPASYRDGARGPDDTVLEGEAYLIIGASPPRVSPPPMLKTLLEECSMDMLAPRLASALDRLDEMLGSFKAPPTPHLFGNFDLIQYDVIDMPPTLLALDSDGITTWGDSGKAQISYRIRKDEAPEFSAARSCH